MPTSTPEKTPEKTTTKTRKKAASSEKAASAVETTKVEGSGGLLSLNALERIADEAAITIEKGGIESIDGIEAGCLAGLLANPHYNNSTAPEKAAELASSIRILLYKQPITYVADRSFATHIGLIAHGVLSNPQTLIPEAPKIVADAVLQLAQLVSKED